ncbi:choice-of-anchor Q domain-containing protein [Pseudomonadota bacterium]
MKTKQTIKRSGGIITSSLSVCGLWLAAATLPVFAADFTVNDLTDAVDLNPGDGVCEVTDATSDCTLRAAIMETNALAGADTITVPAGTIELTLTGVDEVCDGYGCTPVITSDASMGDLDINDDLTITGAGADLTTVQWAAAAADDDPTTGDRIFHVAVALGDTDGFDSVVIQDLAVANGEVGLVPTVAADVCIDDGEGTLIYTPANLNDYDIFDYEIGDSNCADNTIKIDQFRRMGGAIAFGAGYAIVTYEQAIHGPDAGGGGGGGADMGPFPGGKPGEEEGGTIAGVTLNRVAVIGSWAGADGGGLYSAVPATLNQVAISGNTSNANGGGIYNDAVLSMSGSLVGKLFDADSLVLYPELANPNVGENGGGMFDTGAHITSIVGSAINGNEAIGGGGIAGRAGITINIDNSTISGNTGTDVGGGITTNGTVNLQNVTVANNVATTDAPGGGGGLNSFGGGTYDFNNTVLFNNQVSGRDDPLANCGCSGGSASCPDGVMNSGFYNIEDGDSCDLSIVTGTDLANTDPLLSALADNGGLTETHALASDSPAVDQGFQVLCTQLESEAWGAFDQRGADFARSLDGNRDGVKVCDMGAYEYVRPRSSGSSSGGFCSYHPDGRFDPVLPAIVLIGLIYVAWRRKVTQQ